MRHQPKLFLTIFTAFSLVAMTMLPTFAWAAEGGFGSKEPGIYNLIGQLYYLPDDTQEMPADIDKQKPIGTIYTECLDIPEREFEEGFPGVSDRFEYFGLIYTARFQIENPGKYGWRLDSDDGSILWIDGKEVVNNDGEHGFQSVSADIELAAGIHDIRVWFFQGPACYLGLQLFVTPPGGEERIFNIADFSKNLELVASETNAVVTKEGIKINFDAAVLFDTGKYELKPGAVPTIKSAAELISTYPEAEVKVYGHTDSVGSDEDNQTLSENRANAVKEALEVAGIPSTVSFDVQGFGETSPIESNDTETGRQKNRRVELLIQP